jgi:membrane associated rhomboid family serine protease
MRNTNFNKSYKNPPKPLKILLWAILSFSLLSAALNKFFIQAIEIIGPQDLLSLSQEGARNGYLWQPLTYLFIHPAENGISFFFLLHLFFNIYLLWMVGSSVIQKIGSGPFIRLFLVSGIAAGFFGQWIIHLTSSSTLVSGASPGIYAILVAWTMLFPDIEMILFGRTPIKAKWLVIGFLGLALLSDLSDGHFMTFVIYSIGATTGYLYSVIAWGLFGPFSITHRFDRLLFHFTQFIRQKIKRYFKPVKAHAGPKIYDIKTGEIILDDHNHRS